MPEKLIFYAVRESISPKRISYWLVQRRSYQFLLARDLFSHLPSRNDTCNIIGFELENYLESASTDRSSDQLIAITIGFVTAYRKIREETLYGFFKCDAMCGQFISLSLLEIRRGKTIPVNHSELYSLFVARQDKMKERPREHIPFHLVQGQCKLRHPRSLRTGGASRAPARPRSRLAWRLKPPLPNRKACLRRLLSRRRSALRTCRCSFNCRARRACAQAAIVSNATCKCADLGT